MANPPRQHPHCPFCRAAKTYRIYCVNPIIKGRRELSALLDEKKPALSTADGTGMSMEAQRQAHGRILNAKRKEARQVQQMRRGTKRKDDEMRHVGSMPVEMFRCAQRTRGRHFYKDKPKEVLKEFGCYFDE